MHTVQAFGIYERELRRRERRRERLFVSLVVAIGVIGIVAAYLGII